MILGAAELALMHAVDEGEHDDMKKALLAGALPDAFDGKHTALSKALLHGPDYEAMRILLDASANPNVNLESEDAFEDWGNGLTPLMISLSDPAAFSVILSHTKCGIEMGRQNNKGQAMVDLIPDRHRSEIHALLSLYYGDEKQTAELRTKADAAGAPKVRHPARMKAAAR